MGDHTPSDPAKLRRQARLEETLKTNLKRRKEQARARRDVPESGEADEAEGREES